MIKNGVLKVKADHRDFSYHRTYGSITPVQFTECNFDVGFPVGNQAADGLDYGCTGYTQAGLCQDIDKIQYVPKFTYDETLQMEGISPSDPTFEKVGCDIRDSLNSTIVYGVQAVGETPAEALNHRRGAYYAVEQVAGMDMFDSIRSALQQNQRSVSFCTPWYAIFAIPQQGIIQTPPSYDTTFATWHNSRICGWKLINGVPYLINESHQGAQYGVNGFCYFPREVVNQLLSINGSGAFTLAPFTGATIQNVQLTILQTIISFAHMILAKLKGN
jgi:hypothetical protein